MVGTSLDAMDTLFAVLHVVAAVFIVGPMAILPMTAMRAVRAGNDSQVDVLAKSTNLISLLSLIVVFLGFGLLGISGAKHHTTLLTPWVLWSIIFYAIALAINLFLVVPTMRRAAEAIRANTVSKYPAIAAGSGISSLLLVAVVVLMVWRP